MDLDETLIHSCHIKENPEIILDIRDENSIKKVNKKKSINYLNFQRLDLI